MPFTLADIVVESVIKDGLQNVKDDPTIIDDVFGSLTRAYADPKYGAAEIDKIKTHFVNNEVPVVHSFHLTNSYPVCISIQLADDDENIQNASMGDYETQLQEPFTDPSDIANITKVGPFQPDAYDPVTGIVSVPDSVDLSQVYANLLFVDSASTEHVILGGIDNTLGQRKFTIAKQAEVSLDPGATVETSITYNQYTINGNREVTQIIIGLHTQEPLLTKYLYTLVKYFLLTRKEDLCSRSIQLTTYKGSDFSRNLEYRGDAIFTRFIHLRGQVYNTWRQDKIQLIDNVEVTVIPIDDC